jgi:ABC-type polysaccharide/polyol phosphate export permease
MTLFTDIWCYRYALRTLVLKDFRVRYRNMSLGIFWSVLNPLIMLGVLVVVFSYIHPQRQTHYFPVFLLLGLVPFNFFSLVVPTATACVLDHAHIIKKVAFPRVIIPLAVVLSQIIHLFMQMLILFLFILLFRVPLHLEVAWIPLIYFVELIFLLGTAYLLSALNVFYRDILYLVQSGLTVMFWFTPIFYALPMVRTNLPPPLYYVYILNPLAGCIDAGRRAVLEGRAPDPLAFGVATAVAVIVLILGLTYFSRREGRFAERI